MGSIKKLDQKKLTSSKRLWKIVKPSFTDKEIKMKKIYLLSKVRPFLLITRYEKNYVIFKRLNMIFKRYYTDFVGTMKQ